MVSARQVAAAAGVSVSTVSRALSAPDQVSSATLERVLEVATRLGYHPNAAARGLRLGRSHAIGLIIPDLENPFFAAVTKAVQARARGAGYVVVVVDSDEDPTNEPALVAALAERTDGLLFASPRSDDETVLRLCDGVTTVVVNRLVDGLASIAGDDFDGTNQVVGHLHALGHRRIAVAAGPAWSWSGARRSTGLREAAARLADVELVELGNFLPYVSGGVLAADHALASGATAVVAFNDLMAVGLLSRLRARGVRVPDEVSVTGFDDVPVARLVDPALTTVRVPQARLARRAVDFLIAALEGNGAAAHLPAVQLLPPELVVRQSTDSVRRPAGTDLWTAPHGARTVPARGRTQNRPEDPASLPGRTERKL